MKKWIMVLLLATCMLQVGCSSPETVAMIAGAGSGATHTLLGISRDLEEALVAKNTELRAALENIETATTEAEKLAAEAKAKALQKQIEALGDAQTGTALVAEGLGTDWTSPPAVGGFVSATIMAVMAWLARKNAKISDGEAVESSAQWIKSESARREIEAEHRRLEGKYKAANQGMEAFRLANTDKAGELYEAVGNARSKVGVTV